MGGGANGPRSASVRVYRARKDFASRKAGPERRDFNESREGINPHSPAAGELAWGRSRYAKANFTCNMGVSSHLLQTVLALAPLVIWFCP